jgi:Spy/CpxP family protein refolding chaperone
LLGLDDKQAQSLRQIGRERMRKMDEAQFKLRQKQGEFADLLEQENPDGNALAGTVKSLHALRKQAAEIDKEYRAKTEAVLNAEQLKKWKEFEQTRRGPRPGPAEGPMGPMPPQGGPDGPGGPGAGRD